MKQTIFKYPWSLATFVLCAFMSMTLFGCSSDDGKPEDENDKLTSIMTGLWWESGEHDEFFVINADGTGAFYENYDDYTNKQETATLSWSYNKDGWVQILTQDKFTSRTEIDKLRVLTVSQNKIVWKIYIDDEQYYEYADGRDIYGYYELWTWERMI